MEPSTQTSEPDCHGRGWHHRGPRGLVGGLVLIVFGALLYLRELGMLPAGIHVRDFWPLLVIGFGLSRLAWAWGAPGRVFGLVVAAAGVVLLLGNLQLIDLRVGPLWPLLIVLAGIGVIVGGARHRHHRHWRHHPHAPHGVSEASSADQLHRSVTMGGAEIRVESQQFKGGELSVVMGGVELDLRRAALAEEGATLDLYSVMGGIEIRVPESWRVVCEVTPILGGVEDKTQPPLDPSAPGKRLLLTGSVIVGGVNVRN